MKYTAGPDDGEVRNIAWGTVSNRGIAEKTVTFTVEPAAWDVTFEGTDTEVLGPVPNGSAARSPNSGYDATGPARPARTGSSAGPAR